MPEETLLDLIDDCEPLAYEPYAEFNANDKTDVKIAKARDMKWTSVAWPIIAVTVDGEIEFFDDMDAAEKFSRKNNATMYFRKDWYDSPSSLKLENLQKIATLFIDVKEELAEILDNETKEPSREALENLRRIMMV